MAGPNWVPPEEDRELGLSAYSTHTPGVEGRVKARPDDFHVAEVSAYPPPDPDGPFVVLRVESTNWEQHELAQRIARAFGLPPHSVGWAGTKDRRAVTEQLLSYRGPSPPEDVPRIPGIRLLDWYRARRPLALGHLYGNSFAIVVRDLAFPPEETSARFSETHRALREEGGLANFFGPQRFGEVRPITHEVGRALVRGEFASAVDIYLCSIPKASSDVGAEARRAFAEHRDPMRALREFPREYRFERSILEHLARGQPPERALRALSRELRMLFVHAYQSWLWNRWLSRRMLLGASLRQPEVGDRLLRVGRDGTIPGLDPVEVRSENRAECAVWAGKGRARIAGPLVGFETPTLAGPSGEIFERLLAEDGTSREWFQIPAMPELASRGSWRPLFLPTPPIGIESVAAPPEDPESAAGARFRFGLPRGSYATVLLREFLKTGATRTVS